MAWLWLTQALNKTYVARQPVTGVSSEQLLIQKVLSDSRQEIAWKFGWEGGVSCSTLPVFDFLAEPNQGLPADGLPLVSEKSEGPFETGIPDSHMVAVFSANYLQAKKPSSRQLGHGGFGSVELCYVRGSGQKCAVKVFAAIPNSTFSSFGTDFFSSSSSGYIPAMLPTRVWMQNEAVMLQKLQDSPYVPALVERLDSKCCIVMEYIKGGNMTDVLPMSQVRRQKVKHLKLWNEAAAKNFAALLLQAIDDIHARGVCHRDLKPANIMWSGEAEKCRLYLVDFNLATELDVNGTAVGVLGTRQGTPIYAPPEELLAAQNSMNPLTSSHSSSSSQ